MVQPQLDRATEVERVIDTLDRLLRDMRLGRPSQHASERHADIARRAAARLDATFRGEGRPVAPPLMVDGNRAAW